MANSSLKKFSAPTHAIRLVCTGQTGGGWFQEGISPSVEETLQTVYRDELSDFDMAALVWWARNQIVFESGLLGDPRLTLLKYEALVTDTENVLRWLFKRLEVEFYESVNDRISSQFVRRHDSLAMDGRIQDLCDSTTRALDTSFRTQRSVIDPR